MVSSCLSPFHYSLFFIFSQHTTSWHSIVAYGFGVCFEMGKKCSKMCSLYIPSLWVKAVCGLGPFLMYIDFIKNINVWWCLEHFYLNHVRNIIDLLVIQLYPRIGQRPDKHKGFLFCCILCSVVFLQLIYGIISYFLPSYEVANSLVPSYPSITDSLGWNKIWL